MITFKGINNTVFTIKLSDINYLEADLHGNYYINLPYLTISVDYTNYERVKEEWQKWVEEIRLKWEKI